MAFLVALGAVTPCARGAVTSSVVDLPVGAVTQRFLHVRPDAPIANVVLLPGGDGVLGIQNDGTLTTYTGLCNPIARNRQSLADHGLALALVDADSSGAVYGLNDLLAVINYIQGRDNVPTWVIGASASTNAAANLAVNLPQGVPAGLILFSPALLPPALAAKVTRTTLVLFNPLDTSQFGPQDFAALTSAPVKENVSLSGGNNGGCGYHLFNGLDAEFVAAITGFIDKYNASLGGGTGTTGLAIEYYYDVWNFYFETSFPNEISALDGGAFGGAWKRTGQQFNVWTEAGASALTVPTCRFFSTAFAPRSSHFYTPFAAECALVKTEPEWQYEAIAFYIALADDSGLCPAGTVPLYRAYNNGMGGAPNHRYTTSLAVLDQMLAAGWVFEGHGVTKVFACVAQ